MKNIISEKKLILLAGGFHKVKSLALSLIRKGYRVIVINKNYADCHSLAQIQALEVIYGDASKPFVLEEAGAAELKVRCERKADIHYTWFKHEPELY